MPVYRVQPGDSLASIAHRHRFIDEETIWSHPQNAPLKQARPNANILHPGDALFIPEKQEKWDSRATAQRHVFRVASRTQTLRLCIEDGQGRRLADTPYTLKIGSTVFRGRTDGAGLVEQVIPLDAGSGELAIPGYVWPLSIGHLNPVEQTPDRGLSGIVARLQNLGYSPGSGSGTMDERTRAAIRAFQRDHGLPEDGECGPGSATLARLIEKHGC